MAISKVTIVGAGTMGHGIGEIIAISGIPVVIEDAYPEALKKAEASIKNSLLKLEKSGKIKQGESEQITSSIRFSNDLGESVKDSDMIIEAVPEIPDLKIKIMKEISEKCRRDAIIASNTSNILISTLSKDAIGPERILGAHFFNPPVVLKLVEVIKSEKTSDKVFSETFDFIKKIGKTPIRVLKDTPGFVVNRINAPEALLLCLVVQNDFAKPEEVDALGKSMGLPMGPYELIDYVGIDTMYHSLKYYGDTLSPDYNKCTYYDKFMKDGALGAKSGRGFYVWENGHAKVPQANPTSAIDMMDIICIEINEAVKVLEEGITSPNDIETGIKLGMNRPFGPISAAEGLTNSEVKNRLIALSKKFGTDIFSPAKSIQDGKLKQIISSKPAGSEKKVQAQPETTKSEETPVILSRDTTTKVAYIEISNTRNNLISVDVINALKGHLEALWNDKEINVIVIRGKGNNLSAGAQLTQFVSGPMDFAEMSRNGERTYRMLSEIPKITIAEMKGYVLGGGFELSTWCDIRVSTPDAVIGFPEVTLGLVPGWGGSQRLAKLLGLSRASYLILSGQRFDGNYAENIGLVSKIFPTNEIEQKTSEFAASLASSVAPISAALAKRLMNKGSEVPADNGLEMESMAMGLLFGTDDLKEGISAFVQKRKPEYKGR